ncbi:MAG: V-type ATPase subunit [Bacillota bacterium]|nr:V-type ATPase subunit [Bacillota bacterium]
MKARSQSSPGWRRPRVSDQAYAHATGRLRVIDAWRMGPQDFASFASEQATTEQRHQILTAAGYPEGSRLEERVLAGRRQIDCLLRELTRDGVLARGLLLERDYHNLKVFMKALTAPVNTDGNGAAKGLEALPQDLAELVMYDAPTPPARLYEQVRRQQERPGERSQDPEIPDWLARDVRQLLAIRQRHPDPVTIDQTGDRLYFAALSRLVNDPETGTAAGFLGDYLTIRADAANLQMLARTRAAMSGAAYLRRIAVVGGTVGPEGLAKLYDADYEEVVAAYKKSLVPGLARRALNYDSRHAIWGYNQAVDQALDLLAASGLHASFGPDAVGSFWLDRTLEISSLRILIAGLEQGYAGEELLSMLRPSDRLPTRVTTLDKNGDAEVGRLPG